MKKNIQSFVAVLSLALCGCGGSDNKPKIGYSALTLKNPFFKVIANSIEAEGKKHGYEVIVTDAERSVKTQSEHVDSFIAQGVVAIVLNPADRVAIGPAIKKANAAGIPVFTCDLQCVAEGAKVTGHIGTDNYSGGKQAGAAMVEALGANGGKVLILHFAQANSCVLRVKGFREVIGNYNKDKTDGRIEIVDVQEGGGLQSEGMKATSAAIQKHMDLAGIFAINDPSALGAWDALDQVKKTKQVTIVGFDGQLIGKRAILYGKIYADPIQFPAKMGVATVENIVKYNNGEPFEEKVLIPTKLYKKADAEVDPDLKK